MTHSYAQLNRETVLLEEIVQYQYLNVVKKLFLVRWGDYIVGGD